MLSGFWWGNVKKDTIGSLRIKWTYNIKMHLEELGLNVSIWIYVAWVWDKWRTVVHYSPPLVPIRQVS